MGVFIFFCWMVFCRFVCWKVWISWGICWVVFLKLNVMRVSMYVEIVVLFGDGIGLEVVVVVVVVLKVVVDCFNYIFIFSEYDIGGIVIDCYGELLLVLIFVVCQVVNVVLLGVVGGLKWFDLNVRVCLEQGLLVICKVLGLYVNLCLVCIYEVVLYVLLIKVELLQDVDFVVVCELIGGIYFGDKICDVDSVSDLCCYIVVEIECVLCSVFCLVWQCRGKVILVDKVNVFEILCLWCDVVVCIGCEEFLDVVLEYQLVDLMVMYLLVKLCEYDVIVIENMFGDIFIDEVLMLVGLLGLLLLVLLGELGVVGIYEFIYGLVLDIVGKGIVNLYVMIFSVVMLLCYLLGLEVEVVVVEVVVYVVLDDGVFIVDLVVKGKVVSMVVVIDVVLVKLG